MDVLERVRDVNAEERLSEDRILEARSRLLERIDATAVGRKRASRRPVILIAGVVAGAAAVTAAAVIVSQPASVPSRIVVAPVVTATPAPVETPVPDPVNTSGAGVGDAFPGTTPRAGQYLQVGVRSETLLYRGPDVEVYQWQHRRADETRPPTSALLVSDESTLYVPGDRAAEWVQVNGPRAQRVQPFPSPQPEGDVAAWANLLPPNSDQTVARGAAGTFDGYQLDQDYSVYPRDPQMLLDHLREGSFEAGESREDSVLTSLLSVLRSNTAPADVRQVFRQALVLSGRAVVDSVSGDITTYGVVFDSADARRETISIDARTGWATEFTMTSQRNDGGLVPSTIPEFRQVFTVSIVDAAP